MPVSLHAVALVMFWPLAAVTTLAPFAALWPRHPGQRSPWGVFAAAEWLYALDLVVLSRDWHPILRGVFWLIAAWRMWRGVVYYRRWQDDDENRARRRRRVWRLAFGGAR